MRELNPIELQKTLAGVDYPCGQGELVRAAQSNGAGDDVLASLRELPEDATFAGPDAVSTAVF